VFVRNDPGVRALALAGTIIGIVGGLSVGPYPLANPSPPPACLRISHGSVRTHSPHPPSWPWAGHSLAFPLNRGVVWPLQPLLKPINYAGSRAEKGASSWAWEEDAVSVYGYTSEATMRDELGNEWLGQGGGCAEYVRVHWYIVNKQSRIEWPDPGD
jgi:hypothetical protein